MIPELDEHFTLNLTSVVPTDGSTPTSAASLRPGYTEVNITIQQSDYPNGLLQFMSSVPLTNETISPSTSQFNVDVRESAGVLTLHVIRAQGTLGTLRCSSVIFRSVKMFITSIIIRYRTTRCPIWPKLWKKGSAVDSANFVVRLWPSEIFLMQFF